VTKGVVVLSVSRQENQVGQMRKLLRNAPENTLRRPPIQIRVKRVLYKARNRDESYLARFLVSGRGVAFSESSSSWMPVCDDDRDAISSLSRMDGGRFSGSQRE